MADLGLRRLEHESLSTPGDEDLSARLIAARLRAGELTDDQIRLASFLDHRPAQLVLGHSSGTTAIDRSNPLSSFREVISSLFHNWGKEATMRAMIAAAHPGISSIRHEVIPDAFSHGTYMAFLWCEFPEERESVSDHTLRGLPRFDELNHYVTTFAPTMAIMLARALAEAVLWDGTSLLHESHLAPTLFPTPSRHTDVLAPDGEAYFPQTESCIREVRSVVVPWALRSSKPMAA